MLYIAVTTKERCISTTMTNFAKRFGRHVVEGPKINKMQRKVSNFDFRERRAALTEVNEAIFDAAIGNGAFERI